MKAPKLSPSPGALSGPNRKPIWEEVRALREAKELSPQSRYPLKSREIIREKTCEVVTQMNTADRILELKKQMGTIAEEIYFLKTKIPGLNASRISDPVLRVAFETENLTDAFTSILSHQRNPLEQETALLRLEKFIQYMQAKKATLGHYVAEQNSEPANAFDMMLIAQFPTA